MIVAANYNSRRMQLISYYSNSNYTNYKYYTNYIVLSSTLIIKYCTNNNYPSENIKYYTNYFVIYIVLV